MVAAWILLKENCGIVPILAALLTIGGVAVIMKPPILLSPGETYNSQQLVKFSMELKCMFQYPSKK